MLSAREPGLSGICLYLSVSCPCELPKVVGFLACFSVFFQSSSPGPSFSQDGRPWMTHLCFSTALAVSTLTFLVFYSLLLTEALTTGGS